MEVTILFPVRLHSQLDRDVYGECLGDVALLQESDVDGVDHRYEQERLLF
jgi:hypothetical protein